MAASVVQDAFNSGGSVSSIVTAFDAPTQVGNVVLFSTFWAQTGRTVTSVTDNGGNVWSILSSNPASSGTSVHKTVWSCVVSSSFTEITANFSGSVTTLRTKAVEATGVQTSGFEYFSAAGSGVSPNAVIGTCSPTVRSLLVMFASKSGSSEIWEDEGIWTKLNLTQTWDECFSGGVQDSGTYDIGIDWEMSATRTVLALVVALPEASDAPPDSATRFKVQFL